MLCADNFIGQLPVPVFVAGPSGIGKTTAINALLASDSEFARPRSFTSRLRRTGETDSEYSFVDRKIIEKMYEGGLVPTIDDVYGNLYAMENKSIHDLLGSGRYPIKEIHPNNITKLRRIFPGMISVGMLPMGMHRPTHMSTQNDDRERADSEFYARVSPYDFDIPLFIGEGDSPADTAACLGKKIRLYNAGLRHLPRTPELYRANKIGYEAISSEFTEAQRITTRNFHELSARFFIDAVSEYVTPDARCMELGPGQGWLRRTVAFPSTSYLVVDLSPSMLGFQENCISIEADVSGIPLRRGSCDVVLASLADPFCHPLGLTEIYRILSDGGVFIFSIPSATWAKALRPGEEGLVTTFTTVNGSKSSVYSITYEARELIKIASICGFKCLRHCEMMAGDLPNIEGVSPAIIQAAQKAGLPLSLLPVVDCYVLTKPSC